jgi:hypothetical protein
VRKWRAANIKGGSVAPTERTYVCLIKIIEDKATGGGAIDFVE